jgi:hypothetical protein
MGIIDAFTLFSGPEQDLTGETDTTVLGGFFMPLSGDATHLRDVGGGQYTAVRFYVTETFADVTSVTFQLLLSTDDSGTSPVVFASSPAVLAADLTVGASFDVPIAPIGRTIDDGLLRRYLGVQYVIVGGATTAGAITASVVTDTTAPGPRKFVTGFTGP